MHQHELSLKCLEKPHRNLDATSVAKCQESLQFIRWKRSRTFNLQLTVFLLNSKNSNMMTRLFRAKVETIAAVMIVMVVAAISCLPRPTDRAVATQKGAAAVYSQNCARCHGSDGRAQTAKGRQIKAVDLTSDDWSPDPGHDTRIITRGKGSMPGFGKKLTPAQISALVQYIRRFK